VRLENAVDKAAAKGARDSLIMLDDKAINSKRSEQNCSIL
jgi:hypothetical protein